MDAIELGVASASMAGEPVSADRHVARVLGNTVLIAVVDGLGHGQEAARAALTAVQTLETSPDAPLEVLTRQCHEMLRTTRGVVMNIAVIDTVRRTLTWLGVGNVAGVVFRAATGFRFTDRKLLVQSGGVVGHWLPPLRPATVPIAAGDTIVFATDGVDSAFEQSVAAGIGAQRLADQILSEHGTTTDDALVLVVRVRGNSHE